VDPSRAYRVDLAAARKDHRNIDQRVIGLGALYTLSTLAMWAFGWFASAGAKHAWLLFNLALLFPIASVDGGVSGLSLLQVGCLLGLSFPLAP